ncbi:MAG: hypothetical protein AAF717_13255 [Bacteroidota bacterium]
MKRQIFFLIVIVALCANFSLNAQLRPYLQPIAIHEDDGDGARRGGGQEVHLGSSSSDFQLVDIYGNPICCESSGEFNFNLTFSSFSTLIALENEIARAQRAAVERWLRKQEETFRKEINRQMGKNYSSFTTARREYFKFYEGGKYGNLGPVLRANKLSSDNSRWSKTWGQRAGNSLAEYEILNDWINCGFCEKYKSLAWGVNSLGDYDHDSSPSPKFYAPLFRDTERKNFGEAYYLNGLNKSRASGLAKLAQNGNLLGRLSDMRVQHYRNLGWQDKVFQMSAYLVNYNINCSSPLSNCLPRELAEYKPPVFWTDDVLNNWAKDFSPEIPYNQAVFGEDFINYLITTEGLRSSEAKKVAENERNRALEEFIDPRNKLCGNYNWRKVGTTNTVTIRGLRVIIKNKLHSWIPIPVGETIQNMPTICVAIPNFRFINGVKQNVTQLDATVQFNIAWQSALYATWFELRGKKENQVVIIPAILANLELMLNNLTPGSKVSRGPCTGSTVLASNAKFCE